MSFPDETKREVWLALRQDGAYGDGSAANPYDASSPTLFKDRMRSFQKNTRIIHIGPGIFQVPAFDPATAETNPTAVWQIQSGWRIIGAGMFITTLKVVGASRTDRLSLLNANDVSTAEGSFLNGFTISDLTIDCNMRGHIGTGVAIGGIAAYGSRVRFRRIRAIDFGTEGPSQGVECFVLTSGSAGPYFPDSYDCVIQDCLIEKPYKNGLYNSTCILFDGGESAENWIAFHRSCVVRNCLIHCEYQDNPVPISSIVFSGDTATAATKVPHNRRVGEWLTVAGALENSLPSVHFNGSFQITAVPDPVTFQFAFFQGDTHTTPPTPDPVQPTGDMWIGKTSSDIVGIKNTGPTPDHDPYNPTQQGVTVSGPIAGQWTVTLVTEKPHLRRPGENVILTGVTVDSDQLSAELNALHRITEVVNPAKLRFLLNSDPGTPDPSTRDFAQINPTFASMSADAGVGAIVENSRVYHTHGGYYHDTWAGKDVIVRKCHFYAVGFGVYQHMGGGPTRFGSSLVRDGTTTAIFTSQQAHHLNTGDTVLISGAAVSGSYSNPFNGSFQITKLSDTAYKYTMASDPEFNAAGSPVFSIRHDASSLTRDSSDPTNKTAKFQTSSDTSYQAGEYVLISGASQTPYNGTFIIIAVSTSAPFWFTYEMVNDPGGTATGSPVCSKAAFPAESLARYSSNTKIAIFTSETPHGFGAGDLVSVYGAAVNDSIVNAFNGAFAVLSDPAPTSTTFAYQMASDPGGDAAASPRPQCAAASACPLTSDGTVATFTTPLKHTLEAGQGIIVSGAGSHYDGGFIIKSVPSPTTFSYEMASSASGNGAPSAEVLSLWQVGRQVVERNVVELRLSPLKSGYGPPFAIGMDGANKSSPYFFVETLLRRNIVRTLDNALDPDPSVFGITLNSFENGIVGSNIALLNQAAPIRYNFNGSVSYFNNQTPSGHLIQGASRPDPPQPVNEVTTDTDLSLISSS